MNLSKRARRGISNTADAQRRKDKMLARLRELAPEAVLVEFAVADGKLLPGVEKLRDWAAFDAPQTVGEMRAIESRLETFLKNKLATK